jgi:hypothetical protein
MALSAQEDAQNNRENTCSKLRSREPTLQKQCRERPARLHALRKRRGTDIADLVLCTRRSSRDRMSTARASAIYMSHKFTVEVQFRERPARLQALRERRGTDIANLAACTRRRHSAPM